MNSSSNLQPKPDGMEHEVIAAGIKRLDPLGKFEKTVADLDFIQQRAKIVMADFQEAQRNAKTEFEQADRELKKAKSEIPPDAALVAELEQLFALYSDEFQRASEELDVWRRESARRAAIALCTAFESFMRDFFIEHMTQKPDMLESYFSKQVGTSVRLATMPLKEDEVDECIARKYRAFQDLGGSVQDAFKDFLQQTGPFSKKGDSKELFLATKDRQSVFSSNEERLDALADIRMLFELRHQLIHRNGKANKKYQDALEPYRRRLIVDFLSGSSVMPGPDEILASPPFNTAQPNENKLEECSRSLLSYARFIVQVYG